MTLSASRSYKKANPLWIAVENFSRAALWNRYVELQAVPNGDVPSYFVTPSLSDGTIPNSDSPLGVLQEQRRLFEELTSDIIRMLIEQQLLAVGYLMPKRRGDQPIWIPSEYWNTAQVDWGISELRSANVAYQDVRVLHSREFRESARRQLSAIDTPKVRSEPGRPSREPQVVCAWNALIEEGEIPKKGLLRSLFPLVRAKVHELYPKDRPDDVGLGEKLLYQVLSPRFKLHKSRI